MKTIDLALRFAAVSQLLLLAVLFLREYRQSYVGLLGALYAFGVGSYLLCPYIAREWHFGLWAMPFFVGCFGAAVFFWLFSRALFDDRFRLRTLHGLAVLLVVGVGFWRHGCPARPFEMTGTVSPPPLESLLALLPQALSLGFIVLALAQAQLGRGPDLVESRRRFRDVFVVLSGAYMVIIVVTEIFLKDKRPVPLLDTLNASVIFLLVMGFTVALIRLRSGILGKPQKPVAKTELNPADQQLLDRLLHWMEVEKGYREEGLTITRLAETLDTQEYRLRRLINTSLDFRNFNEFLNGYRVQEACARLSDPQQIRLPVLTIALELGYRSLGPFNRAFKEHTGLTPTEYRKAKLSPSQQDA